MNKGELVLVRFPFTDLSGAKLRPALALTGKNREGNVLLAFVSSQMKQAGTFDIKIDEHDTQFHRTGFKKASIIKMDKLITLNKRIILGKIGRLPEKKLSKAKEKLRVYLEL